MYIQLFVVQFSRESHLSDISQNISQFDLNSCINAFGMDINVTVGIMYIYINVTVGNIELLTTSQNIYA